MATPKKAKTKAAAKAEANLAETKAKGDAKTKTAKTAKEPKPKVMKQMAEEYERLGKTLIEAEANLAWWRELNKDPRFGLVLGPLVDEKADLEALVTAKGSDLQQARANVIAKRELAKAVASGPWLARVTTAQKRIKAFEDKHSLFVANLRKAIPKATAAAVAKTAEPPQADSSAAA